MSWFLHNAVADLYGPYFLAFYTIVIGVVILTCRRSVRAVDRTDEEEPKIPAKIDPYEVAYLRGGKNEVTRVAIASLIQRGILQIVERKTWGVSSKLIDRRRKVVDKELSPIKSCVANWSGFPAKPGDLFGAAG